MMSSTRRISLTWCAIFSAMAAFASPASGADPLPPTLSGRFFGNNSFGRPYNREISLRVTKQEPDGKIEGTLTREGFSCASKDDPFTGTYDGTALKIRAKSHPVENSRGIKGDCGDDNYSLKRDPNGSFEGTFGDATVVLKP